jgi:putative nucleotidyltransferase with HDIG domain
MTRAEALAIVQEFTKSESLIRHAFAVEAAMRAYAEKLGEDAGLWAATGLLHDFDYDQFPEEHPYKGNQILTERGIDEEIRTAIMGHASFTGVARLSPMAKTLYAVDELCGFIGAVALVKPNRSLSEVSASSVRKKMKDKRFAAKVNRDEIIQGAEELGVEFDTHVEFVIQALRQVAVEIGLNP